TSAGGMVEPGMPRAYATIDGSGAGPCVQFTSQEGPGAVLEGFRLTHGAAPEGGGIYLSISNPTIRECLVDHNAASNLGGGIRAAFSSPLIERCVIASNSVSAAIGYGGGLSSEYGFSLTVQSCTFYGNSAASGAGIECRYGGGVTIRDSIL